MGWNKQIWHALACLVFAVIAGFAGWSLFVSRDLVQAVLLFMASIMCVFHGVIHLSITFTQRDTVL